MPVLYNRCKNEQHMFSLRHSWKLFFFFPVLVTCYLNLEALSHTWFFMSPSCLQVLVILFLYFFLLCSVASLPFIFHCHIFYPQQFLCGNTIIVHCLQIGPSAPEVNLALRRSDFPSADLTVDSCTKNLHCLENHVQTSGHNLESPSQPVCILLFKIHLPLYLYLIPLLCSHWVIQFSSTNDTLSQLCTLFALPLAPPLFTRHFVQIFT